MPTLTAAVVLLAVLTIANLFILLGVVRKLREAASAPAGRPVDLPGLPALGSEVTPFREDTLTDEAFTDEHLRDGVSLLVFMSPHCGPCTETVRRLTEGRDALPARVVVLLEGESGDPDLVAFAQPLDGIGTIATFSSLGPAARAFGVTAFPTAVLVDSGYVVDASFDYADLLPNARESAPAR